MRKAGGGVPAHALSPLRSRANAASAQKIQAQKTPVITAATTVADVGAVPSLLEEELEENEEEFEVGFKRVPDEVYLVV